MQNIKSVSKKQMKSKRHLFEDKCPKKKLKGVHNLYFAFFQNRASHETFFNFHRFIFGIFA